MLKYIIVINWVFVAILGLLLAISFLSPTKGGDAAGQGMGQAILNLATIALVLLLILNLIPFPWAKYTAFALVLLPFAVMLLDSASTGAKDLISAIKYDKSDYDGSRYFPDQQRKTIMSAIYDDDIEEVDELLREPVLQINDLDIDQKQTILDYTATHYSPYSRDWEKTKRILELLIAAGATINSTNPARVSTHAAIVWNATSDQLKFFLDHGADPNANGENNVPILYEAIRSGGEDSVEKVKLLLDRGAKIDVVATYDQYTRNYSPLLFASSFEYWDVCLLLIRRGADIHYTSPDGNTLQQYIQLFTQRYNELKETPSPEFEELKTIVDEQTVK
ncbi:ankyrin repeat domain-containing protein [Spirosoma sp.]|uniref:ankyrin repeat domain-containing protein n=1 Tax=Spirosoma sp. TaxID=1899569 RepID=UPI003B3B11DB